MAANVGGIERRVLEEMIAEGLTIREVSERLGRGYSTVRYRLRKYDLRTERTLEIADQTREQSVVSRVCRRHGLTAFDRRRRVKRILVAEAGGRCALCGYDRYAGALQFHHRDPSTRSFALSAEGMARSLEKARAEARKCILVCANCHAEVEGGIATIPQQ